MKRVSSWSSVVNRIEQKLAGWKNSLLSIGERVTLITSVLNSVPLYALSMFWAPVDGLAKIENLKRIFL